jgi:hypothetical protein
MVIATITERGILSANNNIKLIENTNNKAYNLARGAASGGTADTIILEEPGDFVGKAVEIIYGTGKNQTRIITGISSSTATVSPPWGRAPDNTSVYIIHVHSGVCQDQTHHEQDCYILLGPAASSVDDYYVGSFIKILHGNGQDQISEIIEYESSTKLACVSPAFNTPVLNNSIYAIYGEGGLAAGGTSTTITLDGNQSVAIAAKHYIELISGAANGQVRMISAISGNTVTVAQAWAITPDENTRYILYGGWAPNTYENIIRYTIVTVASDIDTHEGERVIIDLESAMTADGSAEVRTLTELSSKNLVKSHALTVVSQFFRLKIVSMGTGINGYIQTIFNSYKSGKVTSKIEGNIWANNDCDLTKSVLVGKTSGGSYKNITSDYFGNLTVTMRDPVDAFGSINVTQPRQFAELMFLNDFVNISTTKSEIRNGGSVAAVNNICVVSAGTNTMGGARMYSMRRLRYTPGLAVAVRFTAIFSEPIENSTQLIGIGDSCDGLFMGYDGIKFGILHRHGGKNEIRRLTISAASTVNDTITVTLNGVGAAIAILATDNTQAIARKVALAASSFAVLGGGWDVYEEGASVLFISRVSGALAGSYSYAVGVGDSAGSFTSIQAGVAATDTWIYQYNWNVDRAGDDQNLPVLNPQKGNVYEIAFQWLGFGYIIFKVENPNTGHFQDIHHIKYPNTEVITSLRNPNLPLAMMAEKNDAGAADINVKAGSMGIFIMGDNNKALGPRAGITGLYNTASGALTGGVYYNILAIRNMPVFNGSKNVNEIMALNISFSFQGGSSVKKGGIFTFFANVMLNNTNTITWTKRSVATSVVEYSTDCYPIIGGSELLSRTCGPSFDFGTSVLDLEMNVMPGVAVVVAFKPFQDLAATPDESTAIISCNVSWVQR